MVGVGVGVLQEYKCLQVWIYTVCKVNFLQVSITAWLVCRLRLIDPNLDTLVCQYMTIGEGCCRKTPVEVVNAPKTGSPTTHPQGLWVAQTQYQ